MEDRRKSRRLELEVAVQFSKIEEGRITTVKYEYVKVSDMSRSGIGFSTTQELKVNDFYDTKIRIWTGETLDTVVKIIRGEKKGDKYQYGGVFVGMTEMDAQKIDIYQMFREAQEVKE